VPVKIDIAVPLAAVPQFTRAVAAVVENVAPESQTVLWGHLGDGNIHVNVLGAGDVASEVEARILRLAAELGGTVSAEHGVGVSKAGHLDLVRSPEELDLLRTIKTAFDPAGTMNPGVVFPGPSRSA
jgi:FAD/FMN-containing dehydrogenase